MTKREFIDPHKLGCGLKLWEQIANHPSTGTALLILCAAMPERRGGGDLEENEVIGRWAGDRIALVGDYAEDTDLPKRFKASTIYSKCRSKTEKVTDNNPKGAEYRDQNGKYVHFVEVKPPVFKDISDIVCKVIEKELGGKFKGDGWRDFIFNDMEDREQKAVNPDMVVYSK